jgi:hypothetical protein
MKKRLVWALIAVTLLAVVFSFWIWHLSTSGTTTARVARLLAENIPPGTHIDDVTAWIHSGTRTWT